MRRLARLAAAAAAASLLATACVTPSTSTPSEPWAGSAQEWVDNAQIAAGRGVPNLAGFLAAGATLDERATGGRLVEGRSAVLGYLRAAMQLRGSTEVSGPVYVSASGLLAPASWDSGDQIGPRDVVVLTVLFGDGTLARAEAAVSVVSGRSLIPGRDWEVLEVTAQHHVDAWATGDTRAATALYRPDVVVRDDLLGVRLTPLKSVLGAVRDPTPLRLGRIAGLGGPAVYGATDGSVGAPVRKVVVLLESEAPCPGHVAAVLTLAPEGTVVAEERYHRVDDVRRCVPVDRLPDGWWGDLAVPDPDEHRQTGVVTAGGTQIEIWNGTPELEALVAWGVSRFRDADLPVPAPASVTFEPASRGPCSGAPALASGESLGEITLCFGVEEACPVDGCLLSLRARRLTLHELAHTWMEANLAEAARAAYCEAVGLAWSPPGSPRADRAVERAAETLTWGLLDEHVQSVELSGIPTRTLSAEFRLLTGRDPLPRG